MSLNIKLVQQQHLMRPHHFTAQTMDGGKDGRKETRNDGILARNQTDRWAKQRLCYIVNLVNWELCCLVPLSFNFHEFVSFDEVNLLNFPFQDMSLFPPRCLCLWPGN